MAQRLVRKICQNCITSYTIKKEEAAQIEKDHGINIAEISQAMSQAKAVSKTEDFSSILFFKGKGCNKCGRNGYKGRIGIYEVLPMTEEIKNLVNTRADSNAIRAKARGQGMITMLEDGFLKAKAGVTTIEEILRVTKE